MRIDLTNIDYVKGLQSNLRAVFESPAGKEVMDYLEQACGWYHSVYDPTNMDMCLINDGKRQVVATLKSLLREKPEDITALVKQKEQ